MNYSPEQTDIFNWFANGKGNAVVRARAGTGKTTTIKEAFNHAPEKRMGYFVFNKKNQVEAAEKIKDSRVDVKTLHALGYKFLRDAFGNIRAEDDIEADRLDSIQNLREHWEARAAILKLVGFAKNTFVNPTREEMEELADERDIYFNGGFTGDGIGLAMKVLEVSKQRDTRGRISFNDMVWLPCALNLIKPIYDLVAGDEGQDLNVPQLQILREASRGRIAIVGDDRQMIYSFRGCHADGLGMMKEALNATELKLTTTYRCPKKVVAIAREIVPDYVAADSAIDGEVSTLSNCDTATPGDFILSRKNAPLMPLALSLLRKNIPARIEGRDIGRQLLTMVKSMKAASVPNFFEKCESWFDKQVARVGKTKNADKKLETSKDIKETLQALAENATNVAEIEQRIYSMFQDTDKGSKPAVILSTVHKAKGLESRRVFMLSKTFNRGKTLEEDNLFYVAVTRSMEKLHFVSGE